MGQHKYNPTAIAAKEGKIKPKKKLTRREERELLYREISKYMPPLPNNQRYCW